MSNQLAPVEEPITQSTTEEELEEDYTPPPPIPLCTACNGGKWHPDCQGAGCQGCGGSGDCPKCKGSGFEPVDG